MTERMTAKQYRQAQTEGRKEDRRRVRGTIRTEVDGESFDSKTEAQRWQELLLLQMAGDICGLRRQVEIGLIGRAGPIMTDSGRQQRVYRADFVYVDNALGTMVVEDRKGHETEKFKLIKAILSAQGIEILITRARG
ncbi:MAG: hypothetical protein COB16_14340 [Rhodobacteraceae bacterium]|nr:MAG: hypothetical protein COB16_14340 [Paracoccaceae bacterium]